MGVQFESSDPRTLIVTFSDEAGHDHLADTRLWLDTWARHIATAPERFGILLVSHAHDEDEPRDEALEDAQSALMAAFRRDYRALANERMTGYASAYYNERMTAAELQSGDRFITQFAEYVLGIRGGLFRDQESAQRWLDEVAALPPLPLTTPATLEPTTTRTAIVYGSTTGVTELVAERVRVAWQVSRQETLPLINVGDQADLAPLLAFDQLLIGVPTWNVGKLQDDWQVVYPHIDQLDLSGVRVALFGVGDQFGYPENFQDALGILGRKLRDRGASLTGFTSVAGYEHSHSRGVEAGQFMGLAIDDKNQPELTDERITHWVDRVATEFAQPQRTSRAIPNRSHT